MDGAGQDFERWRARGDSAALGRVFDAQAPALLRFGVHLLGDANAAEDLVQETFLSALRQSARYDASRPIDRWLAGILVRHAQEVRRDARRIAPHAPPEQVDARTPFDDARSGEERETIARALDRLDEPYRSAAVLHVAHGLSAAEIAHALGRSPGAVRVQLHRARELLRSLLPAGIASGLVALLAEPARGLECVRNQVLREAAQLAPAVGVGGGVLAGAIVMKKIVLAAVVLLVGLVAYIGWSRGEPLEPSERALATADSIPLTAPGADEASVEPEVERSRTAEIAQAAAADAKPQEVLRGIVLDADTDEPVVGARIALYAPIEMTVREMRTRYWDRLSTNDFGMRQTRPWPYYDAPDSSGIVLLEFTPEQRVGLEPIRVRAPPPENARPFVETTSGPDGRFELHADSTDAFLTCDASGYAQRAFATRATRFGFEATADRTIYVARNRKLRGRIFDAGNHPLRESIALSLYGHAPKNLRAPNDPPDDPQDRLVLFHTDQEGRFELDVDAHLGFLRSADARWRVTQHGYLGTDGVTVRETPWFDLLDEEGDLRLTLAGVCSILVRDAETREPIEDAYVNLKVSATKTLLREGWYHLDHGRFALPPALAYADYMPEEVEKLRVETVVRVWAPGYEASSKAVADLFSPDVHEIDLRRDASPPVAGHVRRGLEGARGARVMAYPAAENTSRRIAWKEPLAGARTDDAGSFSLVIPPGRYVLEVEHEGDRVRRALDVPGEPVDVDLDATATLLVRLTRADGSPSVSRAVRVRDEAGIETRATTDRTGSVRIERLPTGMHEVSVSHRSGEDNFRAGETRSLDLVVGDNEVAFNVPGATPMHARLVVEDGPVRGWSVQRDDDSPGSARSVEPDGRIPFDFSEVRHFVLIAPVGTRHSIRMPADAKDGAEVRVRAGGPGYRGRLVDAVSGESMSGVDLWFTAQAGTRTWMVTTDAEGRFEVRGLEPETKWAQSVRKGTSSDVFGSVTFELTSPPSDPPAELVLRRPRFVDSAYEGYPLAHLEGRFTSDPRAVFGKLAYVSSIVRGDGYSIRMSQEARVGADGTFQLRIPATGERSLALWGGEPYRKLMYERWTPSGTDPEVREFQLPP